MMELELYWPIGIFALYLVIAVVVFAVSDAIMRRPSNERKARPYVGGERLDIRKTKPGSASIYWPMRRFFEIFYNIIGERHTGVLSDYLIWTLVTLVILLVVFTRGMLQWV